MILELLTPLILATAPQTTDGLASIYSHSTQNTTGWEGTKSEIMLASSTRTFMADGKPFDSDMD